MWDILNRLIRKDNNRDYDKDNIDDRPINVVLDEFLEKCPEWIVRKGVAHLKTILDNGTRGMIYIKWKDDPIHWWASYHHGWGTAIRNSLRDHVCTDAELPSGNWDDYYIQLVEIACGARDNPTQGDIMSVNEDQASNISPILKYFEYTHLTPPLQVVSEHFYILAHYMEDNLPNGPEKSAGLRKLLEAKDCAVRAKLGQQ